MLNAFVEASGKVLTSKFFTRTHCTYKYGHIHVAQKEQQNSTLLIEHGVNRL
jgi:hypothetical protein